MASGIYPEFALLLNNLFAPQGTIMMFFNTASPLGWAVQTSTVLDDCSVRVNRSTGGSNGGSTTWSSWNFGGTFGVNGFTISVAQMPNHNHGINDPTHNHGVSDSGHQHALGFSYCYLAGGGDLSGNGGTNVHYANNLSSGATTGIGINGNATGVTTQFTGSGSGIFPTYTTPSVKYVDGLLAAKS